MLQVIYIKKQGDKQVHLKWTDRGPKPLPIKKKTDAGS